LATRRRSTIDPNRRDLASEVPPRVLWIIDGDIGSHTLLRSASAGIIRPGASTSAQALFLCSLLELLSDRLRDELCIELGALDLVDVDVHVLLGQRVNLLTERVDFDTGLADDDARASRVDVDGDPLLVLADQDVGQARVRKLADDVLADLDVLEKCACELLLADHPIRLPVVDDADAQAAGMNLLSH
jgi:hypothetical protein